MIGNYVVFLKEIKQLVSTNLFDDWMTQSQCYSDKWKNLQELNAIFNVNINSAHNYASLMFLQGPMPGHYQLPAMVNTNPKFYCNDTIVANLGSSHYICQMSAPLTAQEPSTNWPHTDNKVCCCYLFTAVLADFKELEMVSLRQRVQNIASRAPFSTQPSLVSIKNTKLLMTEWDTSSLLCRNALDNV